MKFCEIYGIASFAQSETLAGLRISWNLQRRKSVTTTSMIPGEYNFTIYKDVQFGPKTFIFKDGEGTVIPLTDLTAKAQARPELDSPDVIDLEPEITDAAGGEVTMELPQETVLGFPEGEFYWSMVFENTSGQRIGPFVIGTLTVAPISTKIP